MLEISVPILAFLSQFSNLEYHPEILIPSKERTDGILPGFRNFHS
jgi:hypothetical protein